MSILSLVVYFVAALVLCACTSLSLASQHHAELGNVGTALVLALLALGLILAATLAVWGVR